MTLSVEQKILAEKRICEAGLEARIRVHLLDYRSIPVEFEKAFDAFISVEMLEVRPDYCSVYLHTYRSYSACRSQGMCLTRLYLTKLLNFLTFQYYTTYFKLVDYALKLERAAVVVTSSTFPESRYTGYQLRVFMSFVCTV